MAASWAKCLQDGPPCVMTKTAGSAIRNRNVPRSLSLIFSPCRDINSLPGLFSVFSPARPTNAKLKKSRVLRTYNQARVPKPINGNLIPGTYDFQNSAPPQHQRWLMEPVIGNAYVRPPTLPFSTAGGLLHTHTQPLPFAEKLKDIEHHGGSHVKPQPRHDARNKRRLESGCCPTEAWGPGLLSSSWAYHDFSQVRAAATSWCPENASSGVRVVPHVRPGFRPHVSSSGERVPPR